jgi:hypothetical protein
VTIDTLDYDRYVINIRRSGLYGNPTVIASKSADVISENVPSTKFVNIFTGKTVAAS